VDSSLPKTSLLLCEFHPTFSSFRYSAGDQSKTKFYICEDLQSSDKYRMKAQDQHLTPVMMEKRMIGWTIPHVTARTARDWPRTGDTSAQINK